MVTLPAATPVTTPVLDIVAFVSSLELHVPPAVALLNVVVEPAHTVVVPVIPATVGLGLTVTVTVELLVQPAAFVTVYVTVVLPAATPVTTPELFIVAFVGSLLDQVPPLVALDKVVVLPAQTFVVPVIGPTVGAALTVISFVTVVEQPAPFVTVYEIVTVPDATPVTTPDPDIVAFELSLLDHTPPLVASASVMVEPLQTEDPPVIAATVGFPLTVMSFVTVVEQPAPFVTV
jgi:hypothetical protein